MDVLWWAVTVATGDRAADGEDSDWHLRAAAWRGNPRRPHRRGQVFTTHPTAGVATVFLSCICLIPCNHCNVSVGCQSEFRFFFLSPLLLFVTSFYWTVKAILYREKACLYLFCFSECLGPVPVMPTSDTARTRSLWMLWRKPLSLLHWMTQSSAMIQQILWRPWIVTLNRCSMGSVMTGEEETIG